MFRIKQIIRGKLIIIIIIIIALNASLTESHSGDDGAHSFNRLKRAVIELGDGDQNKIPHFKSPWMNTDWNKLSKSAIDRNLKAFKEASNQKLKAKNVILFLGDGMGLATVAASRVYKAQKLGVTGTKTYMTWENFPFVGLARTYNVDRITPDSAATATAYLCGVKANLGTVGVNEKVPLDNCEAVAGNKVDSILHKSIKEGKWTGIVTTARVTHASPAGCFASSGNRKWEATIPDNVKKGENCKDIAYQLIMDKRNKNIRVIFGGGASNFLPNITMNPAKKGKVEGDSSSFHENKAWSSDRKILGARSDNIDLIEKWVNFRKKKKQSFAVLMNKTDLLNLNSQTIDFALGLFNDDHMSYESERNDNEPSLSEMTAKAIEILSRSPKGYFLFVEGAKIDMGHHKNNAHRALVETISFSDAVETARNQTLEKDTLIVVTSDHSHTFSLGGYGSYQEPLFGLVTHSGKFTRDGKPFLQLMYANGPGFEYHRITDKKEHPRKNLSSVSYSELSSKDFRQDAGIFFDSETHGGEDVAVYASGPSAHLFHSTEEQTYVAHSMMFASCVGDYKDFEHCNV